MKRSMRFWVACGVLTVLSAGAFALARASFAQARYAGPSVSVTIDGHVYACTPTGMTECEGKAHALKRALESCISAQLTSFCVENLWPNYKKSNPGCLTEGTAACVEACTPGQLASWCVQNCQ